MGCILQGNCNRSDLFSKQGEDAPYERIFNGTQLQNQSQKIEFKQEAFAGKNLTQRILLNSNIASRVQELLDQQLKQCEKLQIVESYVYRSPVYDLQVLVEDLEIIQSEDKIIYNGQTKQGKKHGYGVQQWPDGAQYEGL